MDTQKLVTPSDALQERIDSLVSMHTQYSQQRANLINQLQNIDASLLKLEGAIESLADFKSKTYPAQPDAAPESNEESEEVIEAQYEDSNLVN